MYLLLLLFQFTYLKTRVLTCLCARPTLSYLNCALSSSYFLTACRSWCCQWITRGTSYELVVANCALLFFFLFILSFFLDVFCCCLFWFVYFYLLCLFAFCLLAFFADLFVFVTARLLLFVCFLLFIWLRFFVLVVFLCLVVAFAYCVFDWRGVWLSVRLTCCLAFSPSLLLYLTSPLSHSQTLTLLSHSHPHLTLSPSSHNLVLLLGCLTFG